MDQEHEFGGGWTEKKLKRLRKYLGAYTTIMAKQPFKFGYIDAFAGTGYRSLPVEGNPDELLLPELLEEESAGFAEGSARIALGVKPPFEKYIFVEKDPRRARELERLRTEFPDCAAKITVEQQDANEYLRGWSSMNWRSHRAVLFLDPYGMQVEWETIKIVAATEAIDLWLLFPLGVAVNRLLRKDGQISPSIRNRLDGMFGTTDWFQAFYDVQEETGLFGPEQRMRKVTDLRGIKKYFVERLEAIFAGVAQNPLELRNSRNDPLYLLCFAAANKKGAGPAVKIAQHILRD